ncbi:hypothetical protein LguiA_036520 [Lonicera macranthoides]
MDAAQWPINVSLAIQVTSEIVRCPIRFKWYPDANKTSSVNLVQNLLIAV